MKIATLRPITKDMVTSSLSESSEPPEYSGSTAYNVGNEVRYQHVVYGCLVDGTQGKAPDIYSVYNSTLTPKYWQRARATNAYAAVDEILSTPTKNPEGDFWFEITNIGNTAGVGIYSAGGSLARAQFYDAGENLVHEEAIQISGLDYSNWYNWMYKEPESGSENYVFENYSPAATKVRITISGAPTTLGEIALLESVHPLGKAIYGSNIEYSSHSTYQDDEFGVASYVRRPSRINARFDVHGERVYVDTISSVFRAQTGKKIAYVADESRSITIGLGIVDSVSIPIDLPNDYLLSISIKGIQ